MKRGGAAAGGAKPQETLKVEPKPVAGTAPTMSGTGPVANPGPQKVGV
jgi:hypothetical protein